MTKKVWRPLPAGKVPSERTESIEVIGDGTILYAHDTFDGADMDIELPPNVRLCELVDEDNSQVVTL